MNMKKEYLDEIRQLRVVLRKLDRDYARAEKSYYRQVRKQKLALDRGSRATAREGIRIHRRIAILGARIDS